MYLSIIKREEDLVDGRPRWHIARSLFSAAERGDLLICASALVHAEVLGNADVRAASRNSAAQQLVNDWFLADYIEWCDVDRLITARVQGLSNRFGLRGPDAIHLATAIRLGADYFMSNDKGFSRAYDEAVDGVKVVRPQVLWQETLDDAQGA